MPASSLRSGTGTRGTPVPLGMNANSWPAFHLRALRTALGIEIWNFAESFAVSGMVIPLLDRSGIRKKLAQAEPSRKSPSLTSTAFPKFESIEVAAPGGHGPQQRAFAQPTSDSNRSRFAPRVSRSL